MRDIEIPYAAFEAAEDAVKQVRDAAPRRPDDAASAVVARAALHAAAPLILAAELDRWADAWSVLRDEWRDIDGRTVRSSALGHAVQELNARVAELRTSAAVTPEPAGQRVWGVGEKVPADVLRIRDESGCLWSRDGAAWVHSCQDLGAVRSRMADSFLRVCVRTEVPSVPPAEPGAGA